MKKLFITLSLSVVFLNTESHSQTTNELYEFCTSDETSFEFGYCLGVITGFIQSTEFRTSALKKVGEDIPYCVPDNLSVNQMRKIFIKFVDHYPKTLNKLYLESFMLAQIAAFPCEEK